MREILHNVGRRRVFDLCLFKEDLLFNHMCKRDTLSWRRIELALIAYRWPPLALRNVIGHDNCTIVLPSRGSQRHQHLVDVRNPILEPTSQMM